MALIKCPECGREISDKAVSCPGCGYPANEFKTENNKSDIDLIIDKLYEQYPHDMAAGIRELRKATGLDLTTARELMYIRYTGKTPKEKYKADVRQSFQELSNACQRAQDTFSNSKVVHCPKCHSTSIGYQDKVSVGRAAMGGMIAGPAGAVLGGLTGKKGYAVCLNCGKRWKV